MRTALCVLLAATAFAADIASFDNRLTRIASATTDEDRQAAVDLLLNESQKIVTVLFPPPGAPALAKMAVQYRRLRNDTQTGSSSGSAGSTSLVLNPYLADIFGISLESGAILKTVSGNTLNLQIKPAGLFCAVGHGDGARAVAGTDCIDFWKRVGITASFDKSRSNAPSQLVALKDDFSQLTVHFDLLQPSLKKARREVQDRMAGQAQLATDVAALFLTNSALVQWSSETRAELLEGYGQCDSGRGPQKSS